MREATREGSGSRPAQDSTLTSTSWWTSDSSSGEGAIFTHPARDPVQAVIADREDACPLPSAGFVVFTVGLTLQTKGQRVKER